MNKFFKVLVCGSRDIRDKEFMFATLDNLLSRKNLEDVVIIHGDQKSFDKQLEIEYGADFLADQWAIERGVKRWRYPAPWNGLKDTPKSAMKKNRAGKMYWPGAGMYRNKLMLKEEPDACVGFLGKQSKNSGTKNMLKLCKEAGIDTREYYI